MSSDRDGLFVCLKDRIISKQLSKENISNEIQVIPIELNIRQQKWLLLPIYKPLSQDPVLFSSEISKLIDSNLSSCENIVILGDFSMEPEDPKMTPLIEDYSLHYLFRKPTCYKTKNGRCIDLILTNKEHSFLMDRSFETGFSDHYHLIYTILKSTYTKVPQKKSDFENIRSSLKNSFR